MISSVDNVDDEINKFDDGVENDVSYLSMTGSSIIRNRDEYIRRAYASDLKTVKLSREFERDKILNMLDRANSDISDDFNKRMSFVRETSKIKTKLSVTEINKENVKEEYNFTFPNVHNDTAFNQSEIGTILHKVLYEADLRKVIDEGTKYVSILLNQMVKEEMLNENEKDAVDINSIISFANSSLGHRVVNSSKVYKEQSFTLKMDDGSLVQGIIDCYFYEGDEIVLLDYKSTRIKDKEHIKETYTKQIELYKKAIEEATGKKVKESYLYLTNFNEIIEIK